MEKLKQKLHSQVGESIGETLVALLIAALALVMLAGAISSASNLILKSRDALGSYYDEAEKVVNMNSVKSSANVTITVDSQTLENEIQVDVYKNDSFSQTPVIMYRMSGGGGA